METGQRDDGRVVRTPASLRTWGLVLVPLILIEGVVGIVSAGADSGRLSALLGFHIVYGILLVALSGYVSATASPAERRLARRVAGLTTLLLAATAVTGGVFLLTKFGSAGLIDRLLALASIAGAALMAVWGVKPQTLRTQNRDP